MPALTQFVDGTGPIFAGKLFPFVFITIACGAISGFHALISSGTTPKLLANERDIRMIGYGGMMLESFVAIMAMIAATVLDPGVYFAINSPAGVVGQGGGRRRGHHLRAGASRSRCEQMQDAGAARWAKRRCSRAPAARRRWRWAWPASSPAPSAQGLLAVWYHFAIMFEALFILTTLDAGTRVGRFMLQDLLGNFVPAAGRDQLVSVRAADQRRWSWSAWGYFLYMGVIDPAGRHQHPVAAVRHRQPDAGGDRAVRRHRPSWSNRASVRYAWITALPLAWLVTITSTAAWQKLFSADLRIGFLAAANDLAAKLAAGTLPPEKAAVAPQLIFNHHLDAGLTATFLIITWILLLDTVRVCGYVLMGRPHLPSSESPHIPSRLAEAWVRD